MQMAHSNLNPHLNNGVEQGSIAIPPFLNRESFSGETDGTGKMDPLRAQILSLNK